MPLTLVSHSWTGLGELDARVEALIALGYNDAEIREAFRPGAELIADRWRAKVPHPGPSHPYSTGEYMEGIEIGPAEFTETGFAGLDIFTEVVNPEDGFDYPWALEFGTDKMAAQPSAQPAFDESVWEAVELAAQALDAMIALKTGI